MEDDDKKLIDYFIGDTFNKISHENLSLFAFIWTMYIARLGTGGVKDNFYEIGIQNGWFEVDMKVTIKKVMTSEEMKDFEEAWGWDIEKAIEEFKNVGIIE